MTPGDRRVKPTAKLVAERAGVSVTTVSRVLSDPEGAGFAEATKARVIDAARELRYRPSSLAGALRRGVTKTVGLIIPDISDAYFHQIARGLEDAAQPAGYSVILCNTDRVVERERAAIETLYDQNVDAIIFAGGGVDDDAHLQDLPWDLMHVVTVGPHHLSFPSIRVDDAGAIAMAMEHLFSLGRSRVLCIAGDERWLISAARSKGYRRALDTQGLTFDPALVVPGDFTLEAGFDAVTRTVEQDIAFDAVMAFNDYSALGAVKALRDLGMRVPDDVAVVGCDDIPLSSLVDPQITSVSFPQREFGVVAMQTALDLVAGRPVETIREFPYHLEIRGSTRPTVARPAGGALRSGPIAAVAQDMTHPGVITNEPTI